ncbi:MAG TPA: phosphoadenylyl-sulfate reductase [Polyangiaceae bacterium]|nr:phosphoadenylyl-sulfate reductase [Polyangiaceae bacterium]
MVKKRLANGETCRKCAQAEELLKSRGLWGRVDKIVWADEADPSSPGMQLAARFGVDHAPFFVVDEEGTGSKATVYDSVLKLIKERLGGEPRSVIETKREAGDAQRDVGDDEIEAASRDLAERHPIEILRWGLDRWQDSLGIAFSGAEDVVLVHMAREIGRPFTTFCLDTGRLHPETYRFIEIVRKRYDIAISVMSPDSAALESFVRKKGLFSFYEDGHEECCALRKVEPLRRVLRTLSAWVTGQRRDQSPATRAALSPIERDSTFSGAHGRLVKLNPLARWTSAQTWKYIRENDIPFNPLHERGFVSIGCDPCTRAILPGEHERAGRWWWEETTKRECGLHVRGSAPGSS